jgi:TRAP-type C4-dicarboxylate transport system permease small subunit
MSGVGRLFALATGILILCMMLVTSVDVGLRFFFNAPLPGAFEITEIAMGLVIFAGMSLAAARREHITVNLLESRLSDRVRRWQRVFGDLVCAAVTATMGWRIALRAEGLLAANETTLVLQVKRGYVAWSVTLLCAVATAVFLWAAWREYAGREPAAAAEQLGQGAAL